MEDQDRDLIADIKMCLQQKQEGQSFRDKKVLSDRDILGKGLERFWRDFRKAAGELCERLSAETGIALSCRWNGETLNLTRSKSQYGISVTLGDAPPYKIFISGINGLHYTSEVRIILEDSQLDWLAESSGSPISARQAAGNALKALVLVT